MSSDRRDLYTGKWLCSNA